MSAEVDDGNDVGQLDWFAQRRRDLGPPAFGAHVLLGTILSKSHFKEQFHKRGMCAD